MSRMERLIKISLNGDAPTVDAAVRRTLYAIANELDAQSEEWDRRLEDLESSIIKQIDGTKAEVDGVRRLLLGLTGTVVTGILVGIGNALISL